MADQQIKVLVEAILKDKGFRAAVQSVNRVDRQVRKASQSISRMEKATAAAGRRLKQAFAIGAIAQLARVSVVEFAKLERQFNALGIELRRLGLDAVAELPRIRAYLEALEQSGGAALGDSLPVLLKFIGITKDVNAALLATRLASNVAESGLKDAKTAGEALANVLQGEATEAAKSLGIELVTTSGHVKTNDEILAEVIDKYATLGSQLDDSQTRLSKAANAWARLKRGIGGFISELLGWLEKGHRKQTAFVAGGIALFSGLASAIKEVFGNIGRVLADAFNIKRLLAEGSGAFMKALQQSLADLGGDLSATVAEALSGAEEAYRNAGESAAKVETEAYSKARERLLEQAGRKQRAADEKRRKAAAGARKKELEREAEEWQRTLDQLGAEFARAVEEGERAWAEHLGRKRDLNAQFNRELVQQALDTAETAAERREAELELLQLEYEERLKQAREHGADVTQVEALFRKKRLAVNKKYDKAEEEIAAATTQFKKQQALDAAQAAIGALTSIFGQNKALQVAQAVIDTYTAANRARAQLGAFGWPVAAALIAAGLANVRKIMSVDPTKSSGFDLPSNDAAARIGGARWARDMVQHFAAGAGAGWTEALAGAGGPVTRNETTYQQSYGDTIHITGTVIDEQSLTRFMRRARRVERRDAARFQR